MQIKKKIIIRARALTSDEMGKLFKKKDVNATDPERKRINKYMKSL